ncbi:MAG: acyl-CoA dehydrogenase family protein, partial [Deltaproteobacteria bacterium]|nr:acyl-CoA dehydrogenase family protein [Deltaproteobacteria bacterium]
MDFSLNEDQKILIDMIRNFSKQEIIPISYSCDEKHSIPKELFEKAHELGLINFTLPIEYGGGGMGPIESALITENLSYGCPSIAFSMIANALGCNPILQFASSVQKKFWFEQISEKKWFVSFCLTEPQAGSDISGMKTYYEKKNGKFFITGHKAWITNSNLADLFVVFAYPRGSQKLTEMSAFIVPANTPGILRGKVENKIGLKA